MSSKTKTAPGLLRNGVVTEPNAVKKLRVTEQQQRLRRSFFTNILLLGFDREAQEKKDHILYNENMFAVPNNKGALPVLYFLMEKLDPEEVKARFRGFWPVFDKKQEQYFRKELCNWLNKIAQEDPEAGFNSIYPSLLLSPGGYKFEQFLFYLSRYVLLKTLKKECNIKDGYLRCPTLKSSLPQTAHIPKILKCATIKNIQSFLVSIDENLKLHRKWQEATKILTEEYKVRFKKIYCLNSNLKDALKENKTKENCDGTDESRNEILYWIKHQWKDILYQIQSQDADRETIQSVIKSFESKHKLDMQLINACIPDQLLQVKEQQIQEGKVESLYRKGQLDIVSLIKLSNLSLEMYHEKLQSTNVSDCKETISEFEMLSKNHSKFLENIETMRQEMTDALEKSKDSVQYLTEKLSDNCDKVDSNSLVMIPHSPPPKNLLLTPRQKKHLSHSRKSILDSTTILNSEEEAKKILEAATVAVQNCTEQRPINLIDAVKKNTMLSEDLFELKATKQNSKHTKPSLKLTDPTSNEFSLGGHCSTDQTNKDVNKQNTNKTKMSSLPRATQNQFSAKLSREKAMKDYASSVVDYYKTGGNADLQDVTEALSMDAFQSKDKLARSPIKQQKHQKLLSPKDIGMEQSKSDIFLQSPNSLNCAHSSSPLLTPTHVSPGSADASSFFLPSPLLESPTIHSKANQSNSSFKLLSINPNDLTEVFTLPNSKCVSLASYENTETFDCILDDASVHFERPGSQNNSGGEIDQSDYNTPLNKSFNLIGHSRDQDLCQTNSKLPLLDSMETTSASSEHSLHLSLSEKPLEDESDSILVD